MGLIKMIAALICWVFKCRPPTPTPYQVPPPSWVMNVTVVDPHNVPVGDLHLEGGPVALYAQLGLEDGVTLESVQVAPSTVQFLLPDQYRYGIPYVPIFVRAYYTAKPDQSWLVYPDKAQQVTVNPCVTVQMLAPPAPKPPPQTLPALQVRDKWLQREGAGYFTVIQCSDFNLLNRYANGQDITPQLQQRASLGFNCLRVWTCYQINYIGDCPPREALYAAIPAFLTLCSSYGLYVELTGFTGPYPYLPDDNSKVNHWNRIISASTGHNNVILELVNEYNNSPNVGLPFDRLLQPPAPMLSSAGSAIQDSEPKQPYWTHSTYHPDGSNEWQRKVGHNCMEIADSSHKPSFSNETIRCGDNETNTLHCYDAAAGGALLCAGACFHSTQGKSSDMFSGVVLACAQAFADGARSVNLDCQNYPYAHLTSREGGTVIRSYGRGPYIVDIHA